MIYPKFIKIKGVEGDNTGYFVPKLYQLTFGWDVVRVFGLPYLKDRLKGYTIWFTDSEENFNRAILILDKLKKTRLFEYEICE